MIDTESVTAKAQASTRLPKARSRVPHHVAFADHAEIFTEIENGTNT
jgi:hypothetical protein